MIGTTQNAMYFGKTATMSKSGAAAADAPTGNGSASATETAAGTEDRFMTLLVAQMRNQDPLNPLDNAQVTSQLAQINTVRGIEELNKSVSSMLASQGGFSPVSAVGLLGRQVMVPGNAFEWGGASQGDARYGVELPDAAKAARVELIDGSGRVVHTRILENAAAGVHTFDWNGTTDSGSAGAEGRYSVRVLAVNQSGVEMQAQALVPARVNGVTQAADGARLELVGRDAQPVSAVRAVL